MSKKATLSIDGTFERYDSQAQSKGEVTGTITDKVGPPRHVGQTILQLVAFRAGNGTETNVYVLASIFKKS